MTAKYLVVMVEFAEEGFVLRKMLVAKFVAKGDAIAYAIDRCRQQPPRDNPFHYHVETAGSVYGGNIFKVEPQTETA